MITDLGSLHGRGTAATAINERGQIIGLASSATSFGEFFVSSSVWGWQHAFLWESGKMTDLGALGGQATVATDINDRGQIVGYSATKYRLLRAFLWQDGQMTDLGTLGGAHKHSWAGGINRRGQVIGGSAIGLSTPGGDDQPFPFGGVEHPVVWQSGTMTDLGTLSGSGKTAFAAAFNDSGQIVGESDSKRHDPVGNPFRHAFLWEAGTMIDLASSRSGHSKAFAINERGQVAGCNWRDTGGDHLLLWQNRAIADLGKLPNCQVIAINNLGQIIANALPHRVVLWAKGKMTDLDTLAGQTTKATGINDRGQVILNRSASSLDARAFLWENGKLTALGSLGGGKSWANAVNNHNQIVGWSTTKTGHWHAVLWTLKSGS